MSALIEQDIKSFEKLTKVIHSCKTIDQLFNAWKCVENYYAMMRYKYGKAKRVPQIFLDHYNILVELYTETLNELSKFETEERVIELQNKQRNVQEL